MAICRGCGGVLGRDCWNEMDCIQISNSYNNYENDSLIQDLEWRNSVLIYVLNHNKIKIPDFTIYTQNPLVLKPIAGCENRHIDDGLPF